MKDGDFSSTQSKTCVPLLLPSFVTKEDRDIQTLPLPSHSQTADRSLKDCYLIQQHCLTRTLWLVTFPFWTCSWCWAVPIVVLIITGVCALSHFQFAHAADVLLLLPEVCTPTVFVHADFTTYPNIHLMFSDCSNFDVVLLFLALSFLLIWGIYCDEQDFIVHCFLICKWNFIR